MGKRCLNEVSFKILNFLEKSVIKFSKGPFAKTSVISNFIDELRFLKEDIIRDEIKKLYRNKLIEKVKKDNFVEYCLTPKGKKLLKEYSIQDLKIKNKEYTGEWMMVFFDIPENFKKIRNLFRKHLQLLGFYEIQKSVLVYPYQCKEELELLIDYYDLREYVRFAIIKDIDNKLHLEKIFNLI